MTNRLKQFIRIVWMWLGISLCVLFAAETALAQSDQVDPTSLLLGVQPGADIPALTADLQAQGYQVVNYWPDLNIVHVIWAQAIAANADTSTDPAAAENARRQATASAEVSAAALNLDPRLTFVEQDGVVTIAQLTPPPALEPAPNDSLAPTQYALANIRAQEAWDITHGDPAVTVAVIDTGYASTHEDFAPDSIWRNQAEFAGLPNIDDDANGFIDDIVGWDWYGNSNDPEDGNGHGTHIMGTIVATTNNSQGIAGLGRAVRVSPLRIFGPGGTGSISNLVAAIHYAVQQDMPIINLSLTTSTDSPALRTAVEAAAARDILVIAATGNMPAGSTFTNVLYPAVYPTTLAVAATDADDNWAFFSRYGPTVDLAAPGANILSTYLADQYRTISGTSMATAHVSALAALLRSLRPDLSSTEIVEIMQATAVDVNSDDEPGNDIYLGAGRIDKAAALLQASTALTITADTISILPTQDPDVGELRVQVTAPPRQSAGGARLPVHNAVVHYRELSASGEWARTFTNSQGEAVIPVITEDSVVRVELQVGAVNRTIETTRLPAGSAIQLTAVPTATVAGQGPVTFTIQLVDGAGELITATVPVQIETSLGEFTSGESSMAVDLVNGEFSGELDPGTVARTGTLTVTLGGLVDSQLLTVIPAPPATIAGPSRLFSEVSISANSILLNFYVTDAYENPVADGTELTLFSEEGMLESTTLTTQDGYAATTIRLPVPQTRTVSVWIVAHAGPVEIRVDIPAVRVRTFLPALQQTQQPWR